MFRVSTTIRSRIPPLRGKIRRETDVLMRSLAEAVPETVWEEIEAGIKPDGSPQKENSPTTVARKGHSLALYESGILKNPDEWVVEKVRDASYRVEIPPSRVPVAIHLRAQNYDFFDLHRSILWAKKKKKMVSSFRGRVS